MHHLNHYHSNLEKFSMNFAFHYILHDTVDFLKFTRVGLKVILSSKIFLIITSFYILAQKLVNFCDAFHG